MSGYGLNEIISYAHRQELKRHGKHVQIFQAEYLSNFFHKCLSPKGLQKLCQTLFHLFHHVGVFLQFFSFLGNFSLRRLADETFVA